MAVPAPKNDPPHDSVQRIVDTAARLFAEHGFHGVTTRQLSAETGLNVATIHHHVGSKRTLYLRVIEALFEQEERILGELLDGIDPAALEGPGGFRATIDRVIAAFVDLAASHPTRQRLYMRRWLEAEDEFREREAELTLRLYRRIEALSKRGQKAGLVRRDVDIENFLRSFDWLIMGYFTCGAFDWDRLRVDPFQPERAARFTEFLQDYAARMLGLIGESDDGDTNR